MYVLPRSESANAISYDMQCGCGVSMVCRYIMVMYDTTIDTCVVVVVYVLPRSDE